MTTSHQLHNAMGLFRGQARGIEVTGVAMPGRGFAMGAKTGLGDWFTDAVDSISGAAERGWGLVSGQTAQAQAQASAVAIAQAQAQADMYRSQSLSSMVPWIAGGVAVVTVAVVLLKR